MKQVLQCSSTKRELTNDQGSVVFKCPNCLKSDIVRSHQSRVLATKYVCPSCQFQGPN
jgi:predicted RNA-binding Zn-ribbon protein involved in translation (DUF1610 family)